jgi:hypothetical protein
LQHALEQYLALLETNGTVDQQAFLNQFPDFAAELRPHLEGIDLMVKVRPREEFGAPSESSNDSPLRPLATLGDH